MAQDPEDRKQGIIADLGQVGNAAFEDRVETLWDQHSSKPTLDLQTEYARLGAINYLAGQKIEYHDYTLGGGTVQESKGQVPKNLDLLRQDCRTEIKRLWQQIRANRGAVVGQLTATAVLTNPAGFPDPNDRALRGDPLKRRPVDPLLDLIPPR